MKGFKKLLLASAIVAASSSAFAMQAMDDDSLSSTTGQDGLTITLNNTSVSGAFLKWTDGDGAPLAAVDNGTLPATFPYINAGTVGITDIGLTTFDGVADHPITVTLDAGSTATSGGNSVLSIAVDAPYVKLHLGSIYVGNGALLAATPATVTSLGAGSANDILDFNSDIEISGMKTQLLLGNAVAGSHLITMTSATNINVTIGGLSINDNVGGGSIILGATTISNVALNSTVDVTAGGLVIGSGAQTGMGVDIASIKLGTAASSSIGAVNISNINTGASSMTITGH
jgi:hypothetical protein